MAGSIMRASQRRLVIYSVVLAVAMLASLPLARAWRDIYALAFLRAAGELQPVDAVMKRQQETAALYGSALFEDDFHYKLALIRARRPAIVALGSSRALQFRQEFFAVPFVNAGRGMNSIAQGQQFIEEMLTIHRPQLVILTLDLWWLNGRREEPPTFSRDLSNTRPQISTFWSYVNARKITSPKIVRTLLGDETNPVSSRPAIGISALARGTGFRPDGSRDYGARYFGIDPAFDDWRFLHSLALAARGDGLLTHAKEIDTQRAQALLALIQRLRSAGVEVVGIAPPLADQVLEAVRQSATNFAYVPMARAAFAGLPVPVFDFTDPATLGAGVCEFADGLHAGDVAYQRMLLHISERIRDSVLASAIREDVIRANIAAYEGHAVTAMPSDGYVYRETDFLGLGCSKHGRRPPQTRFNESSRRGG